MLLDNQSRTRNCHSLLWSSLSLVLAVLLSTISVLLIPVYGYATTGTIFQQGAGYQVGAYDQDAAQPTAYNWTRQSRFKGPEKPALKWIFPKGSLRYSSPAIGSDGTIYVGFWNDNVYVRTENDNTLYAINPDGSQKWAFQPQRYSFIAISSSPAIAADGTVYVGSWDGNLYSVNSDGSMKWSFKTGQWIIDSPTIGSDGTVYVGSCGGYLYAINPDGSQKWAFPSGSITLSSPAIGSDGTVYIGNQDHRLFAINPDGSKKWERKLENDKTFNYSIWSSPAIAADGTIYVGSTYNLNAINPDGSLKWVFKAGDWVWSSPAIASDGTVYVGSFNGKLFAILPNGTQKWAFQTGGKIISSPIIGADGTVYVGSFDGKLYAINPAGDKKWEFQLDSSIWCSPSIGADGTIYVGGRYAIGDAGSDATSPITSVALGGTPGNVDWYVTGVTVTLTATDTGSGVKEIHYAIDGGAETTVAGSSTSIAVSTDGTHTVTYYAKDNAGNIESSNSITFKLDKTPPVITITGIENGATYALGLVPTAAYTATDATSGLAASSSTLAGGDGLGLGTFTYTVTASDNAGNVANVPVGYNVIATPEGLTALIKQMLASGLIDNEGIANSLTAKIANAQNAANGQTSDNIVQAFINQVEAQAGQHIAQDAAAVLINAAKYVIGH